MAKFFMYDGETYDDGFRSLDEAKAAAERMLDAHDEDARDRGFWSEEAKRIAYGEVHGASKQFALDADGARTGEDPADAEAIDIKIAPFDREVPRG